MARPAHRPPVGSSPRLGEIASNRDANPAPGKPGAGPFWSRKSNEAPRRGATKGQGAPKAKEIQVNHELRRKAIRRFSDAILWAMVGIPFLIIVLDR